MSEYTLYIDENGNSDMKYSDNNRFLSLTGVIIEKEYDKNILKGVFDNFKKSYNIQNIVLHRSDIIQCTKGFEFLIDGKVRDSFNGSLIQIIKDVSFKVITVVIDKQMHLLDYGEMHMHPYHYCLQAIMERFCIRLNKINQKGSIIVEAQGKREDKALSEAYNQIYNSGTYYVSSSTFKTCITNSQLKFATKKDVLDNKIYGLELCDIIAHPSMNYAKKINNLPHSQRAEFGNKISEILKNSKYYRSDDGKIEGFGIKMLP